MRHHLEQAPSRVAHRFGGRTLAAWCLFAVAAYSFAAAAWRLPGGVSIQDYSSGIFDADVDRVIAALSLNKRSGLRLSVHPLFQILLGPITAGFQFLGVAPHVSTRVTCVFGIFAQLVLVMYTVHKLSGRIAWAMPLAGALFLASFSCHLFGVIPESCAWSGVSTLLPVALASSRIGKPYTWREMLAWAALVPLTVGFTVTQVAFWFLGILSRLMTVDGAAKGRARAAVVGGSLVAVIVGAWLVVLLANRQHALNPEAAIFYETDLVSPERSYRRPFAMESVSLPRLRTTLAQMFIYPFATPTPGYSKVVLSYGYFSLSLEEPGRGVFDGNRVLFFWLVAVVLYLPLLRTRARPVWGPLLLLGIFSQVFLHLFYGREFILYSLNWIGLVVALLVTNVAQSGKRIQQMWVALLACIIPLILHNNHSILDRVMAEMRYGLRQNLRTVEGEPLNPLPR